MTILVVEDDVTLRTSLVGLLESAGYEVAAEGDGRRALKPRCLERRWELVLLDLHLPGIHGLDVLSALKAEQPGAEVVVLTGDRDPEVAVRALKLGAADYLVKPANAIEILRTVEGIVGRARDRSANDPFAGLAAPDAFRAFVTASPRMGEVFRYLERIGPSEYPILITGPSGTGKELLARVIHGLSARREGPFLGVNVAAIPADLFASQLFGHVRGAFSGAARDAQGYFQAAAGGTLFLDEIGELAYDLQAQLLRVLQEGELFPVGAARATPIQVRILAASNRDLRAEVDAGRFRVDLYHRLRVGAVRLPSLVERPEDVPLLARHVAERTTRERGWPPVRISPEVLRLLQAQPWPGNVRELENVVREAVLLARGGAVRVEDLAPEYRRVEAPRAGSRPLAELERAHILGALDEAGGNVSRAARMLGISRATLHRKLNLYRGEQGPEPPGDGRGGPG